MTNLTEAILRQQVEKLNAKVLAQAGVIKRQEGALAVLRGALKAEPADQFDLVYNAWRDGYDTKGVADPHDMAKRYAHRVCNSIQQVKA